MSLHSAQEFRRQVSASPELQEAVAAKVSDGVIDFAGVSEIGRSKGFEFSAEDAKNALATQSDELSDFEMELVSGGQNSSVSTSKRSEAPPAHSTRLGP